MENIVLPLSKSITRKSTTDYKTKCPYKKKMNKAMSNVFTDTHVVVATCGKKMVISHFGNITTFCLTTFYILELSKIINIFLGKSWQTSIQTSTLKFKKLLKK